MSSHVRESNVDIGNDMRIIITVIWWPEESDPIRMIRNTNTFSIFIGGTQDRANKWPGGFLNKKNVEVLVSFKNVFHKRPVLSNILQEKLYVS